MELNILTLAVAGAGAILSVVSALTVALRKRDYKRVEITLKDSQGQTVKIEGLTRASLNDLTDHIKGAELVIEASSKQKESVDKTTQGGGAAGTSASL
jgi:predicted dinucleotide-utilizing enzyme